MDIIADLLVNSSKNNEMFLKGQCYNVYDTVEEYDKNDLKIIYVMALKCLIMKLN